MEWAGETALQTVPNELEVGGGYVGTLHLLGAGRRGRYHGSVWGDLIQVPSTSRWFPLGQHR